MITERKAIQEIFDDLQRERKELKANYREDLANLEKRQDDLLTRLERLDGIEREAIDPEGLLQQMADTMDKMAEFIPHIPAATLLDATAEKMAAAAQVEDAPIIYSEKTNNEINQESNSLLDYSKKYISQREYRCKPTDILEVIETYLQANGPSTAEELEKFLKDTYQWEWKAFGGSLYQWRTKYPNRIERKGIRYFLKKEGAKDNGKTKESAPDSTI